MKHLSLLLSYSILLVSCTNAQPKEEIKDHSKIDSLANVIVHLEVNGVALGEKVTPFLNKLKDLHYGYYNPKKSHFFSYNTEFLEYLRYSIYVDGATIFYFVDPSDSIIYKIDYLFADKAGTTHDTYIKKYGEECSKNCWDWTYKNQTIKTAILEYVKLDIPSYYQEDLTYTFIATYEDIEATKKHNVFMKDMEDRYNEMYLKENTPSINDI